ncbi:saccharopine dehydrogenase NADP-binding domain-containing protein [Cellulosimicrobium marinum]|uniref:saccharopine dehydrogenase NADP-binding domain-containing protein n=1 Tax=Cellulosimicrobium marinum TaxID=1638992 RepID=UPI001E2AF938|nr:saccharopine dehydrogenase NADP-binding domain-containing protein [Cellulosimicrobium marinum]MCB7135035.1 saccharopine dehydrogenase NADP-binding domain-containing protein [Cellulosimicrobium marinum]
MGRARSVMVVGGYGVVGTALCRLLADRHPDVRVVVAGRRVEVARALADTLPGATAAHVDLDAPDPLAGVDVLPDAVVVAVNDHSDHLLVSAARRGVAVVDITRWWDRVEDAHRALADVDTTAPVVLSSGWMASTAALVVAAARQGKGPAAHVDVDVLLSTQDAAGPDSLTWFVDVHAAFAVRDHGRDLVVRGSTSPRTVTFPGGTRARTRRLRSPEHRTLVDSGHADGVAVRIAFDDRVAQTALTGLVRSGLWARLPRATRLRLLRDPRATGTRPHEIVVTVEADDVERHHVVDPQGQAHLTAAGAATQVERVLGLRGRPVPPPGISYPEQAPDPERDLATLADLGVRLARAVPERRSRARSTASH